MIDFNHYVTQAAQNFGPLVQPRMGVANLEAMRGGLLKTARANKATVCTITLDSFTRVLNFDAAERALANGDPLNGFPLVSHDTDAVRELVMFIETETSRPIQVRHGSAKPSALFLRMAEVGLTATEGGPVSYCLPYSRLPLCEAIADWEIACRYLADASHVESFAGCMMGQLCDPALLVALNILEARFLLHHGISSVSCSYAQGISPVQDRATLRVLRKLINKHLQTIPNHIVVYVFMGLFPQTLSGFCKITQDIIAASVAEGVERIIVKTPAESKRISKIPENIASLDHARYLIENGIGTPPEFDENEYERILQRAESLIEQTLCQHADPGEALVRAFEQGIFDVPYCLHADNHNVTQTVISNGYYRSKNATPQDATAFLNAIRHNQFHYDSAD